MKVIRYMNKCNYFQRKEDYKKCLMWVKKGIIPTFMKEDYEIYRLRYERIHNKQTN